ncbi:pollen-specific leucine-rich repeat extensin-like protein 3 [Iris pallida]|uniref:Pollen-specific leucine-rich repeat extensin-like protein 3 n=1 Tax=Iris pallida TaxID=29817 RepID=A0AAX6GVB3_IRIPA|nr:pollen-specific leucine-rich repeat extensin-like protein 3 [Iris pallida]
MVLKDGAWSGSSSGPEKRRLANRAARKTRTEGLSIAGFWRSAVRRKMHAHTKAWSVVGRQWLRHIRETAQRSNTTARRHRSLESAGNGRKRRPRRHGTEEHARLWPWAALREMASALEEAEAATDREIGSVGDSCTRGADVAMVVRCRLVGRAFIFFWFCCGIMVAMMYDGDIMVMECDRSDTDTRIRTRL